MLCNAIFLSFRLDVAMEIEDTSQTCMIPPLLLQPLVENAIRHGIAHLVDGGTVSLRTRRENGFLTIEVMNPIDPDRPKALGTGVGMENVRRRLRTLFDSAARVDTSTKNGMFSVEISFPAKDSMQP